MATESKRKLDVFYAFRRFYHVLTIFNWENVQNENRRQNLALAALISLLLFCLFVAVSGCLYHCFHYNFDLVKVALPFALMFTATQMSVTYLTMAIKYKRMEEVIAVLHKIINERNVNLKIFQ